MAEDHLPRHPVQLFNWSYSDAKVMTDPKNVAMATSFREKSLNQWEKTKKLRIDPVLHDLERVMRKNKSKLSLSSSSRNFSSSIGPDTQTAFRQWSQQSWCIRHQVLVNEAAQIDELKVVMHGKGDRVEGSLAEKLLKQGNESSINSGLNNTGSKFFKLTSKNTPDAKASDSVLLLKEPHTAFRNRLVKFYTKYNPTKLNRIDQMLETYSGREDELFQKLQERYVADAGLSLCKRKKRFITKESDPTVYMDISIAGAPVGRIVMRLLKDEIPLASENFRCLCTGEKGGILGLKGCKFHRIIKNFMVQGGDITKGDGTGGQSIYSGTLQGDIWGNFKDEKFLPHDDVGLLSMANVGKNTNGSQFFITTKAGLTNLDGKHVVFGEVIDGLDVVNAMQNVKVCPKNNCPLPENEVAIADCGELKANTTMLLCQLGSLELLQPRH
ncbi:unnamed protein product [Peronospora belbahrii]|uniref:PPIase cyclophilin-type domain-containing protein n=1 Tax=Peronospora belbahrii TaxID=622444 RepID=A0ABN8CRB0_9STRA|nr:unnamed protein product [Peronospora belbahrii]